MNIRAFVLSKGYVVTAVAAGGDLGQVERKQRRGGWKQKTKEIGQHGHPNQQNQHMEQRTVVAIIIVVVAVVVIVGRFTSLVPAAANWLLFNLASLT